jgi:hypothetical protein
MQVRWGWDDACGATPGVGALSKGSSNQCRIASDLERRIKARDSEHSQQASGRLNEHEPSMRLAPRTCGDKDGQPLRIHKLELRTIDLDIPVDASETVA